MKDPRFRARLLGSTLNIYDYIGFGINAPNGIVLIGALPLIIGVWLLQKGLGWEQQMERLMMDMRDSATGGLFSSLLWGLSIISILLAILLSYQKMTEPDINQTVILQVITTFDEVLPWLLISLFSFSLSLEY